jgi:hypothetical protein
MSVSTPASLNLSADYQRRILQANPRLTNELEIELVAFRFGTPEHGRFFHMQRVANLLFTKEHNPDIVSPLDWNPWTVRICKLLCDGDPSLPFTGYPTYVGLTGPASSSKTYSVSLYVFLLWLSSPVRTKGVVSSTSIQAAKNRIWGDLVGLANAAPEEIRNCFALTQSNPAMIKIKGGTHKQSIELIAGDDSQREASDKVLGIKNDWFLLAVDEATEVSHALLEARNNLNKNPRFQMIFIGNAKSHDDPHGKVCEPLKGWDTITVDSDLWATTLPRGAALHLDGMKSPNLDVPEGTPPPFPRLFNRKDLLEVATAEGGENTPGFQRFGRGFWPKGGTANQIYSQSEIELNGGTEKAIWLEPPRRIMGHDVAFSSDGDKSMAVIGELGITPERIPILNHVATEIVEVEDSQAKRRSYAMAERLREIAIKYHVMTEDLGVDCTGTGVSYPEIVDEILGGSCMRIPFNGEVSTLPYPSDGLTKPQEMFDRRVSELWYIGKLYLQKGQFRGLKQSLITDMSKRLYDRGRQNKICVETKRKMRERGVRSPDEADAFMIMLAVARERFGFEVYKGQTRAELERGANWMFQRKKVSFKEMVERHQPQGKMLIAMPAGGWQKQTIQRGGN